jgi:hypothetical protein
MLLQRLRLWSGNLHDLAQAFLSEFDRLWCGKLQLYGFSGPAFAPNYQIPHWKRTLPCRSGFCPSNVDKRNENVLGLISQRLSRLSTAPAFHTRGMREQERDSCKTEKSGQQGPEPHTVARKNAQLAFLRQGPKTIQAKLRICWHIYIQSGPSMLQIIQKGPKRSHEEVPRNREPFRPSPNLNVRRLAQNLVCTLPCPH